MKTHGHTRRREFTGTYKAWANMRKRCNTPSCVQYKYYGGKGIKVCSEWDSFERFLADMGERPPGTSLDRIDGAKDYCKENCRWATHTEQVRNRSNTRRVTANGRTMTIQEWADETGLTYTTILLRLRRGVSEQDAVTLPRLRHW